MWLACSICTAILCILVIFRCCCFRYVYPKYGHKITKAPPIIREKSLEATRISTTSTALSSGTLSLFGSAKNSGSAWDSQEPFALSALGSSRVPGNESSYPTIEDFHDINLFGGTAEDGVHDSKSEGVYM